MSYICVSVLRMICVFMTSEDMQGCCQILSDRQTQPQHFTLQSLSQTLFLNKAPPAQKEPSTQNFSEDLHVKSLDAN